MTSAEAISPTASAATVMRHPKGLFYLAFTEGWERFSFYGMTALVVLYMVNQLLLPGHVEHIAAEFERLSAKGVAFRDKPKNMGPTKFVDFDDTCGNLIRLIEG